MSVRIRRRENRVSLHVGYVMLECVTPLKRLLHNFSIGSVLGSRLVLGLVVKERKKILAARDPKI